MSLESAGQANFERFDTLHQTQRDDEGKCKIASPTGTLLLQKRPFCDKANQAGIFINIIRRVGENTVSLDRLHIDNEGLVRGKVSCQIDTLSPQPKIFTPLSPGRVIEIADTIIRESRHHPKLVLVENFIPTHPPALVAVR